VGIAIDHQQREKYHRKSGRFPDAVEGFLFALLAEKLTRKEAARIEWQHRPVKAIGWNRGMGGGKYRKLFEAGG